MNAANLFTLLRLVLAPFVAADILHGHWTRSLILLFAAGFTDVIDGFLARKFSHPTRAGAYFDPIADKVMLVAIYLALGAARAMPVWMVALVFARDVLILGMAAYGLLFTSIRKFPPSIWGKISTFFQIAAALVVMGDRDGIPAPVRLALVLMVCATGWSGIHYAWTGLLALRRQPR
ncbi:MAG TPA: CDP-alcohol phosphatidyltransferase family protein [Bryobacteraceae bacterium]|nr:CDP-alcohol phosphatidyltransferase family protein [Bryobacteraceae bacterium]